ncbi:MAG TPA: rRNA maturation RNase YbeY [Planctomycetota bacterium]|nr:rRNA maturation RNase YbeY [Planctomycetota bacterium]
MDRQRAVRGAAAACRRAVGLVLPGRDVVVALVDDRAIARLHGRFLGDPTPTDVLSFPHGEIVASGETARREAEARGIPPLHELLLYVVHGSLHLAGYRDGKAKDRARMRRAERRVLASLGVGDVFGASEREHRKRGPVS